jgi:regulator of protease activity HflC (stomatin/prohibitin superfamily)
MSEETGLKLVVTGVVVLGLGVFGGFKFFEKIDNGNVGIEYSMNGGVKADALSQGVRFVGLDKVTQYPIKTQTVTQKTALATSDGKKTDVKISFSYHVDATKATGVYKKFGNVEIEDIEKGWLHQQLTAAGREALSKYTLLEVVGTDSTKVQAKLLKDFQDRAQAQGFVIEDLSFGTPSLDSQTQKSIDDIIKAGQDNKKAELEAKTKQTKAAASAQAKETAAEGAAKATITKAEATAKANALVSDSVTDRVIQNKEADARLKHGWVTTEGAAAVVK